MIHLSPICFSNSMIGRGRVMHPGLEMYRSVLTLPECQMQPKQKKKQNKTPPTPPPGFSRPKDETPDHLDGLKDADLLDQELECVAHLGQRVAARRLGPGVGEGGVGGEGAVDGAGGLDGQLPGDEQGGGGAAGEEDGLLAEAGRGGVVGFLAWSGLLLLLLLLPITGGIAVLLQILFAAVPAARSDLGKFPVATDGSLDDGGFQLDGFHPQPAAQFGVCPWRDAGDA